MARAMTFPVNGRAMNAVICEKDEVFVAANETIEAHIVALHNGLDEVRIDVRELRADYRSLRDKIDQVAASMNAKIDQVAAATNAKIDQVAASMNAKIDQVAAAMNAKIDQVAAATNAKIDQVAAATNVRTDASVAALLEKIDQNEAASVARDTALREQMERGYAELSSRIDALAEQFRGMREQFADFRAMQKAMLWVLGGAGSAAALVSIAKTLGWL